MKLVDILSMELKEWPEDFDAVGQACDGSLHEVKGNHARDRYTLDKFSMCDSYMAGEVVTRAQWQAAVDALKAEKAPAWVGVGLPPDGTVCELRSASKFTEGTRLEEFPAGTRMLVGGRANFGGDDVAVVCVEGRHFCGTIIPEMLRPARTPEQIAAEERHAAIKAMAEIAYDATGFATNLTEMGALYDAGYRKFEIADKYDGEGEV